MNASLRLAGGAKLPGWMTEHLEGNRYVNTIYLCASGMLKFSAVSRIPKGRKVYRGIAGVRLPGLFVLVGVDGQAVQLHPSSTQARVAVSNAAKAVSTAASTLP